MIPTSLGCLPMPSRKGKQPGRATNRFPNRLTLGIDEAGRGPAVGPMVMAAVALDSRDAALLRRRGLKDSKTFGPGEDGHRIDTEPALEIRRRGESGTTGETA